MANEVPPSRFTVMPDKTKEPSQHDFRSGYKRELFERSLDISRSKMDSIKETEQSRYNGVEGRKQSIKKLHLHQMKYPLLDAWLK